MNFWFVVHLLNKKIGKNTVFLVRPESHNQYGFGGLKHAELISIYKNRSPLMELNTIASLWETYQNAGRPIQSLITIMKELDTEEFGPVLREFNKRESIYGFGDLQVKRLFDEIINNR